MVVLDIFMNFQMTSSCEQFQLIVKMGERLPIWKTEWTSRIPREWCPQLSPKGMLIHSVDFLAA